MTNIVITAYCACAAICCGPKATGLAANGRPPVEGITVAASRSIPLGTPIKLTVNGVFTNRLFYVNDRLAKKYDDRVDIYFDEHERAKQFGRQAGSYTTVK